MLIGSGAAVALNLELWKSGTAGVLLEVVPGGLLGGSSTSLEFVLGKVPGLDVKFATGVDRSPRSFKGDETKGGFGEMELAWWKSWGDGRDDVGLPCLTADEIPKS